ncbi:MAG: hypothetical protein ACSHXY_06050 [Alphaproteobacteria bacterium]
MNNRFVRHFAVPMIVSIFLSLLWGYLLLTIWRAVGKSAAILAEGTPAARIAGRLERIDEAIAPVILSSILALIIPLTIWFVVCFRTKVGSGEARKLRGTWISLFLLSVLISAGLTYYQGFMVGNLMSYMTQGAMIVHGLIGFTSLLLGYWLISVIATNKIYKPATLPF